MLTGATLFTGFGGVDLGMRAAGIDTVFGLEKSAAIAEVAKSNGVQVVIGDVNFFDGSELRGVDVIHASPPCPNFSNANMNASETEEDITLAESVARIVRASMPRWFTLENVLMYRKSKSFSVIKDALADCGYMFVWFHLNAADFGVPQTRRRLFLIACRDGLIPQMPPPVPWAGWYAAIEDLIPALPDSQFAPWQMKNLQIIMETTLVGQDYDSPSYIDNRKPVTATVGEPAFTVKASASNSIWKAFIVDGSNASRDLTIRKGSEPVFSCVAQFGRQAVRAFIPGRVIAMTPRALARFQSFPDSYKLPDRKRVAFRGIGNAVPPMMYKEIIMTVTQGG